MSLDDIDIGAWGKKGDQEKENTRKPKPPSRSKVSSTSTTRSSSKKKKSTSRSTSGSSRTSSMVTWKLTPRNAVPIEKVPIDALRGLYYFIIGKTDKKLSKIELKRTLQEFLSSRDKFQRLLQGITDVIKS